MFIGIIGLIGIIVCPIIAVVSWFKKNGKAKRMLVFTGISFVLLIAGSLLYTGDEQASSSPGSGKEPKQEVKKDEEPKEDVKTEKTENSNVSEKETVAEEKPAEDTEKKESTIDTSVFVYAEKVDVTDAIDINDHVTVFVHMSKNLNPGMAAQHVLNQSYDFLQQDDIKGAKTVTIAVSQSDIKVFQFTVEKNKFAPKDNEPMSNVVLKTSKIDHMSNEVKEFAETMEWKISK